jgi:hypothetical protein
MIFAEPKDLFLIVSSRWFSLLLSGVKTTEFRKVTPYWRTRILNFIGQAGDHHGVTFQLGYSRRLPRLHKTVESITIVNHICHGRVFAIKLR